MECYDTVSCTAECETCEHLDAYVEEELRRRRRELAAILAALVGWATVLIVLLANSARTCP